MIIIRAYSVTYANLNSAIFRIILVNLEGFLIEHQLAKLWSDILQQRHVICCGLDQFDLLHEELVVKKFFNLSLTSTHHK